VSGLGLRLGRGRDVPAAEVVVMEGRWGYGWERGVVEARCEFE
jgi:hypothetical protein